MAAIYYVCGGCGRRLRCDEVRTHTCVAAVSGEHPTVKEDGQ